MQWLKHTLKRRRGGDRNGSVPWVAIIWLGIVSLTAFAAPVAAPHPPDLQNLAIASQPPGLRTGDGGFYLLGTDYLGRDMLSRLIWGLRPLFEVSTLSVLLAGAFGLVYGLVAAMGPARLEFLFMRLADIQLSLPLFVLALLMAFTLRPGIFSSIFAIAIATWPYYARLVRADVLRTRASAFVQLARVAGQRGVGLVWRHILPNSLNAFVALCILNLSVTLILASGLSFLGLGVQPPTADLGNMVAVGTTYLDQWWMVAFPGILLCTVVMALNAVGNLLQRHIEIDASASIVPSAAAAPVQVTRHAHRGSRVATRAMAPDRNRSTTDPVLKVEGLTVVDPSGRPIVHEASFALQPGKVLGIIGESGSGKSTVCRALVGLLAPGLAVTGGTLSYGDWEVPLDSPDVARLRGRHIGTVFQDPLSSLNPVLPVGFQLGETRLIHAMESKATTRAWVQATLGKLGFRDPESVAHSYPHQLSGGMRQRICIGIAFAGEPQVVLADEPTTALDVSLQGRILSLLMERVVEQGASLILVTHDVRVVSDVADNVMVMYGGRVLETGPAEAVLKHPASPYTQALLDSIPALTADLRGRSLSFIPPPPPGTAQPHTGCPFAGRCTREIRRCQDAFPEPFTTESGTMIWCWNPLAQELGGVDSGP